MQRDSTTPVTTRLPFSLEAECEALGERRLVTPLQAGDICPACLLGRLDYDGLLNLVCPECGYSGGGGCFT